MDRTSIPQFVISTHDDKTPFPSPDNNYHGKFPGFPSFEETGDEKTYNFQIRPPAANQGPSKPLSENDVTQNRSYGVGECNSSSENRKPKRRRTDNPPEFATLKQVNNLATRIAETFQNERGVLGVSYFPKEMLASLVTDDEAIRTALYSPNQSVPEITIAFSKSNPKVFAITLLAIQDTSSRQSAMLNFSQFEFTDDCLPVENLQNPEICSDQGCSHPVVADAFHRVPWAPELFNIFFDKQWSFCVPMFEEAEFVYPFHDQTILPIAKVKRNGVVEESGIIGEGSFGEVQFVQMLAAYQTALKTVS